MALSLGGEGRLRKEDLPKKTKKNRWGGVDIDGKRLGSHRESVT